MIPGAVRQYLPWLLLLAGTVLFALLVRHAIRRCAVVRRPVLLAAMIAGALPALYVGLAWAELITSGYVRLERPAMALVVLAATSFIAIRLSARTGSSGRQGPWRTHFGDALIQAAAFAAALAATGPELGRPLDRLTILIAIDRSRSIDLVPHAEQRIARELAIAELGMRPDDRIGTIIFGADAATEDPPRPKSDLPAPQRVAVGRDGTDLGAAIRRALAEVPADSAARIVLLTDGVATRGDTMAAAAAAVAAEIPIDTVALDQRAVPDVRLVALRVPTRADEGEAIDLRLVTSSPAPADIEVRIRRDGELIARAKAQIAAGEDVLRIREKAAGPGLHRYDVEITALDPKLDEAPEDNSASAFMRVRGPAAALVLEGDAGKGQFVAGALTSAAFRVEEGSTSSVPVDVGGLAGYDVIVFSDIRAPDLSPGQIEALASYVRDLGGGLILLGGDRSMGPGGYSKTPLEEISPVSFDLKQERRRGSLAEVIGIDISGSMAARAGVHTKLELANEAAARSAALLGPGDMLGVLHVDTTVRWSVPLSPVTDKAAIDRAIRAVGPGGGGIYVDITLDAAYAALEKERVNLKHVLLFADGSDAEQMGPCRSTVSDALRRGITTSVVALGNGSDVPELEVLSRLGNGRFYLIEDATRLPAVFAQETILAARSAIVEKPFHVTTAAPSSIMAGIAWNEAPALRGYVVTIPKSRASVLLTGPDQDPILAVWPAGVGKAAAFTSDLKDRWGAAWTGWNDAARLVAQLARDVTRKEEDAKVRLESDASGGQLHIRANVVGDDGRAQSFRRLVVHVAGPEGFGRELALEASGAGAYTATLPLSRPGTYISVARDELSGQAVGTSGAVLTAGEELRPTGSDLALLARLAEFSGGKRRDTLASIFADRASKRFSYKSITESLLLLAAFALLFAVAARRLAIPEPVLALSARLQGLLRRAPNAPVPAGAPEQATAFALLSARDRARAARGIEPHREAPPLAKPAVPGPAAPPPPASAAVLPRPAAPSAPASSGPPSQGRPLTAAEILLARRKGTRRT